MSIERSLFFILDIPKGFYWLIMCLLTKNVPIEKWKTSQLFGAFQCIYCINLCSLWRNKEQPTKSQTFQFYIILVADPCDVRKTYKNEILQNKVLISLLNTSTLLFFFFFFFFFFHVHFVLIIIFFKQSYF